MPTDTLIKLLYSLPYLYRKDINIIAENIGINKPHNKSIDYLITVIDRYEAGNKLIELGLHKINKRYISKNDLDKATELNNMSYDDLRKIAILRVSKILILSQKKI